jgi:hypothetical protein
MEHAFLSFCLPGQEMEVIKQEDIGVPEFAAEVLGTSLPDSCNELGGEPFGAGANGSQPLGFGGVGDGMQQVCFAQRGIAMDE